MTNRGDVPSTSGRTPMDVDLDLSSSHVGGERQEEVLEEVEEVPRWVSVGRGGRQLVGAPEWAEKWDGRHLIWAAESHLSYWTTRSMDARNMRSFFGYTTMMEAFERLAEEEKAIIELGAFRALVRAWREIKEMKIRANLSLIRAFLDRY